MPITFTVVGARDSRVEELLRATDHGASTTWIADLNSLLQAETLRLDILFIDVRRDHRLPSALAALKRKFPAINVILIASALDGSFMLEAMRAGVNECVAEPLQQADVNTAVNRVLGQRATTRPATSPRSRPWSSSRRRLWHRRRRTRRPRLPSSAAPIPGSRRC